MAADALQPVVHSACSMIVTRFTAGGLPGSKLVVGTLDGRVTAYHIAAQGTSEFRVAEVWSRAVSEQVRKQRQVVSSDPAAHAVALQPWSIAPVKHPVRGGLLVAGFVHASFAVLDPAEGAVLWEVAPSIARGAPGDSHAPTFAGVRTPPPPRTRAHSHAHTRTFSRAHTHTHTSMRIHANTSTLTFTLKFALAPPCCDHIRMKLYTCWVVRCFSGVTFRPRRWTPRMLLLGRMCVALYAELGVCRG